MVSTTPTRTSSRGAMSPSLSRTSSTSLPTPSTPTRQHSFTFASSSTPPPRPPPSVRAESVTGSVLSVDRDSERERKAKRRAQLRDYYGIATNASPSKPKDALDIDAPDSFDPDRYFENLSSSASIPVLLQRQVQLVNEIKELDGERQSLVYNHHHELIEASDTIRKMRSRAETLDTSLESLRTSFESISQLSSSLPLPPKPLPSSSCDSEKGSTEPTFSPLIHLPPLLALPTLLKQSERKHADSVWGSWEPQLRSWQEEGVAGVRELEEECREVLRAGRARGNSLVGGGGPNGAGARL